MEKKVSSSDLLLWNSLCFYVVTLCIAPVRSQIFPVLVWSGMIITNILTVIHFLLIKESDFRTATGFEGVFGKTSRAALTTSLLYMLTCILFKFSKFITIIIPIAFTGVTVLSVIYTIACHVKSIDSRGKEIQKRVSLAIKYSWLIISLVSYYLARSFMSDSFDMPFDTTVYKLMTVFFAMFFTFLFYCMAYILFTYVLTVAYSKPKRFKGNLSAYGRYTFSVFVPLIAIGFFSYIAVYQQTITILKLGFEFSLKYDTRDTFFCHEKYMFLLKHPDARFLYVSPGNYRVFIPHSDDFTISRLTCTNAIPFYSVVTVNDKKGLITANLENRAENLLIDLKAAIARHTQ